MHAGLNQLQHIFVVRIMHHIQAPEIAKKTKKKRKKYVVHTKEIVPMASCLLPIIEASQQTEQIT